MGLDAGTVFATLGGEFSPAGFKQFDKAMLDSKARMEAGEKRITESQGRVGKSTERMGKSAQRSADLWQDSAGKWRNATGQFASDAEKAAAGVDASTRKIETSTKRVSFATDDMGKRSKKSLESIGTAAKYGAAGTLLGFVAAAGYAIKKAADFEQQISSLGSVSGAKGKQLEKLRQQALDAGAATKYSALQAAQAQTELAKGGLSASQILGGALNAALGLAAAGELDLGDAATYTVNAMKLFGLRGKDSTHVADAFATAANNTTADVKDFGMALTQGGSAAKQVGYDFDQTTTVLEALAEIGVKNSDAGTSMKTAFLQLIGPTKKQGEAAKAAGLSFVDQNGHMKDAVDIAAMLRAKTGDLTKAQRTNLFQTLAGTDGFRTLAALYDAGPAKLGKLEQGLAKEGTAAQVAAEKQDNLKGKVENLQGSIETAAISIGSKFLPKLSDLAEKGTAAINSFVSGGGAEKFATGAVSGLETVGHVISDLARDGADAARALVGIGKALDLGDPGRIEEILAAIAGFKVAGTVAPLVFSLAQGLSMLVLNMRTAPSLAAFFADLPFGPIGLLAGAAAALGATLVALSGHESAEAQIARDSAAAHKEQLAAMQAVSDAELAAADKGLAAKQATLDQKKAQEEFDKVRKTSKKGSAEYDQALLNLDQTMLRTTETHKAYTNSIKDQNKANDDAVAKAKAAFDAATKQAQGIKGQIDQKGVPAGVRRNLGTDPEVQRTQAAATEAQAKANEDYIAAVARANVSDTNRHRLMQQSTQITRENTQGVSELIQNLGKVPASKQTKLLLDDQSALSTAGQLASKLDSIGQKQTVAKILTNAPSAGAAVGAFRAVLAGLPGSKAVAILQNAKSASGAVEAFRAIVKGVPASKVLRIESNATSAAGAVRGLQAAIDALHGKQVDVTTHFNQIYSTTGHPSTPSGKVLPKPNAQGGTYKDPTLALVGEDGSGYDEYIVPTNPRYRGRAMELFKALAQDLGATAFAAGKKGKAPKRVLPKPPKDYRVGDPDELHNDITKLEGIADDKVTKGKLKGHLTARAQEARRELKQYRPVYQRAHSLASKITANDERANNAYAAMQLADKKGDQKGFDKALKAYNAALGNERDELSGIYSALGKVGKTDTAYGRKVLGNLLDIGGKIQDAKTAEITPPELTPDQQSLQDTGMTLAEVAVGKGIDAAIALAALTPGLDDDTAAAQQKVDFLAGVLNEILHDPADRGGNDAIAQVAGDLKDARDNLTSLTNPNGSTSNDNADVQAQIDQARQQGFAAGQNDTINTAAALAFGGPGTIGAGGPTAGAAVVQNIYTLHPGDPRTIRAIGDAATGGQDLQASKRPQTKKVGIA